jgi:hypothetical protein
MNCLRIVNRRGPSCHRHPAASPLATLSRALLLLLAISCTAHAQIAVTSGNLTYTQDFNHGYSGSVSWTNNVTLPGWYIHMNAAGTPSSLSAIVHTSNSTTNSTLGVVHLLADENAPANFALGMRINDANGSTPSTPGAGYYFGLLLRNDTGSTINEFAFSYTGFQFFHSTGANKNSWAVAYQTFDGATAISGTSVKDGTWTDIPAASYTVPFSGASSNTALNFNQSPNFTNVSVPSVSGFAWEPGDFLMLRLYNQNVSGVDQGIGFDNVTFTAVAAPIP